MTEPLKLIYVDTQGESRTIEIAGRLRVGRAAEADLVLLGDGISREHCEFILSSDGPSVRDLGSTNGTFVNGSRVKTHRLREGDTVTLGRVLLRVEGGAPSAAFRTTYIGRESVEVAVDSEEQYPPESLEPEHSHRHLQSMYRILETIQNSPTVDAMLLAALAAALDALSLEFGHVLMGPDPEHVAPRASYSPDDSPPPAFSRTVVRRVLRESEGVLANDIQADADFAASESLAAAGAVRIACSPIPLQGQCGCLYLVARGLGHDLGRDDVSFLNAVGRQIGLAAEALGERERLARENELLRQGRVESRLVGSSEAMERLRAMIAKAADSDATVLITGESGTGKELVARGVHDQSARADEAFVALNCGALPATVVQSELFGHEKGAFTGADARKIGLVELAHGGTLFLDEVGELPLDVQVTLLRVLEERRFYRVGGQREIETDVRFVAATNRDLDRAASDGTFRADLLYRLKVVEIRTPALRDHPEDLSTIAEYLLTELARPTRRPPRTLSDSALEALGHHAWPGNVRELRNTLERASLLAPGERIEAEDLGLNPTAAPRAAQEERLVSLSDIEREHIQQVLDATGWNKTRSAEILGVARITLYEKIKNYGLTPRET